MKRAPVAAPGLDSHLPHRARVGQRHRLSGDRRPAVAALGHQSRLHRSQPVVRDVRRRRSARLRALRSRSGRARTFEQVLESARIVRDALDDAEDAGAREDDRLARAFTSTCRSCAGRCRRKSGRSPRRSPQELAGRHPDAHDVRVPGREAPAGARAGRLQPERLGAHARLGLFGPPAPARLRLDAGHVEGSRRRACGSRTSASTTSARASRRSAICGSPCSRSAAASTCESSCPRRSPRDESDHSHNVSCLPAPAAGNPHGGCRLPSLRISLRRGCAPRGRPSPASPARARVEAQLRVGMRNRTVVDSSSESLGQRLPVAAVSGESRLAIRAIGLLQRRSMPSHPAYSSQPFLGRTPGHLLPARYTGPLVPGSVRSSERRGSCCSWRECQREFETAASL